MVWYYLVLAIVISAAILLCSCVIMDYCTYRDLQRRLQEERMMRLEEEAESAYT